MGRVLALDYGTKRTGIAVTDELQLIASGLTAVNTSDLMDFLANYVETESVETILVGEPRQRDGSHSDIEAEISPFVEKLKRRWPEINIERFDERFTSKLASRALIDAGVKKSKRRQKGMIDQMSATILLQDYLQTKRD